MFNAFNVAFFCRKNAITFLCECDIPIESLAEFLYMRNKTHTTLYDIGRIHDHIVKLRPKRFKKGVIIKKYGIYN